ncbi:unnamed protein product [Paramecium primaurelia]|uniref:EGF-like domain-containing protein n=1 Tax=Paramecium primaurelia TaxID=5886 RepID=A0A8S1PP38_PARPR|nr:unnamed protein product [Paramecium primaurelia]
MILYSQFILCCFVFYLNAQWQSGEIYLTQYELFVETTSSIAYNYADGFVKLTQPLSTAYFINCTSPSTSYITLNKENPSAKQHSIDSIQSGGRISIDFYFHDTWSNEAITFTFGTFTYTYTYTSPTNYPLTTGFCDSILYDVKTINLTIPSSIFDYVTFSSSITGNGQVSIRNIIFSEHQIICYPSCSQCTGPEYNQCTSCYYGSPTNNICPQCPLNLFYRQKQGCKDNCPFDSQNYVNGFCQSFYQNTDISYSFSSLTSDATLFKYSLIYDPQNIDTSPSLIYANYDYLFGIFKFNSGFYRFISLSTSIYKNYLVGLQIELWIFNNIPLGSGVEFKINNTYYGSIFQTTQGVQTHKIKIEDIMSYSSCYSPYTICKRYELYGFFDIPPYSFLLTAQGNYTNSEAGWGISMIRVTKGYCDSSCLICDVPFVCLTCRSGYYKTIQGTCVSTCSQPYQNLVNSLCQDYDDETPYSKYLIKEYINLANDPTQQSKYVLLSQNGVNFLKGSSIYYSYWKSIRVFGGQYVWAQAKFSRTFSQLNPHHSVTIGFYILYGPNFPADGQFIYSVDSIIQVQKSLSNSYSTNTDNTKYQRIQERLGHNQNTMTITWECFGPNNEPLQAYCAVYNFYIAVHYCQPYCLSCTDQQTCTQWDISYNSNVIKFSQVECLSNQYYFKPTLSCLDCPSSCLSCTSQLHCLTCQTSYIQTKEGCVCKINQYEYQNQCYDCPIECNQCLSATYCIECLTINNRRLLNGQCVCINGYYPIVDNPICLICHKFCETCSGPTNNDCITCKNISMIEQIGSTCSCPLGTSYQESTNSCNSCHFSCQTCFRASINGCLTCNQLQFRVLKGLECVCQPGYYEVNNDCIACPIELDSTLSQCYKQCNNNSQIWHSQNCLQCDSGFIIEFGECRPICGDLQVLGYEQCEDGNSIFDDKCYNCQFQCPQNCLTCDSSTVLPCPDICGDGIITGDEECEDGNSIEYDGCYNCKYQCQPACTKCIKGLCYECATSGWQIDPTQTPWVCKEKCGDSVIVGSEQCEDGNIIDTDGCKDCRFFCRQGCLSCDYNTNTCLSCNTGFRPVSYYCKNICGDGLIVTDPTGFYSEQCDDKNTISTDGCNASCQYQCQSSTICLTCLNERCESCATGYILSLDKVCIPICGDSIKVSQEICEDGLIMPYQGCQNCQPKCQPSCLNCGTLGQGCTTCKTGYNRINNICYSICGDKLITEDEECDDGNLIYDDGCHQCKFNCQASCLICVKGVCLDCIDGYQLIQSKCYSICGDGIQTFNEQCDFFGEVDQNDGCKNCLFQNDDNCQVFNFGLCQLCKDGYEISPNLQQQCVKQLDQPYGIIDHCQFPLSDTCVKCDLNADYDIFDGKCKANQIKLTQCEFYMKISPNLYCNQCFPFCIQCYNEVCVKCQEGYYLNQRNQCVSQCGDGILAYDEQCEFNDKDCFSCQIIKPQYCKYFHETCLLCQYGYYLEHVNNSCYSICGDNIVASNEECEDGNEFKYDGCYNCKYQCQQECSDCQLGKCVECVDTFVLNQSNSKCEDLKLCGDQLGLYYDSYTNDCIPRCGDGILAGKEECEDSNSVPYDGCYECKYQCDKNCTNCQKGICFECILGLYLNQQKCVSKCGDGIKNGEELCDDQNDIPRDGCTQCKVDPNYKCQEDNNNLSFCYKCQDHCIECIYKDSTITECLKCDSGYFLKDNTCNKCSDKCKECENTPNNCKLCITQDCSVCDNISGLYLDKQLQSCVTKCGDNIIAGIEQCDDGNNIDKDGCNSKCNIEKDFICKQGVCYEPPKKKIDFSYKNSTTTSDVDLLFNELELEGICDKLKINIDEFQQNEFNYTVFKKSEIQENMLGCEIRFNFFKTILESNLIHLLVPLIKDSNRIRILDEDVREIVIIPRKQVYYNQQQQAQAKSIVSASSTFTLLLQLIGPLTILLGGFNFFWTILDILTWINNFYFLNVDYPLNVKMFFNQLEWGDIISIPDVVSLNQPDDAYYFEAPPKFTEKDVNPLFFNNIQLFFALIFLVFLIYFLSRSYVNLINKKYYNKTKRIHQIEIFSINQIQQQQFQTDQNIRSQEKIIKKIIEPNIKLPHILTLIYKEAIWFNSNFRAKLIQVIGLVFLDICLASILQLKYSKNSEFVIIVINIISAYLGILFIVLVFKLYKFVCSQHPILYENQQFSEHYSSLYEGINTNNLLAKNYCIVNLIRKALFIFFTVYFYELPLLQTSFCCLSCFSNLALILYENPFENKQILIQVAVPDLCIFIIIFFTVILAIHDVSQLLTFEEKYMIGWIILFFIGFSIFVQLVFLFKQFYQDMKERYQSIKEYIKKKKEQSQG